VPVRLTGLTVQDDEFTLTTAGRVHRLTMDWPFVLFSNLHDHILDRAT
jgi:hypothetical protein